MSAFESNNLNFIENLRNFLKSSENSKEAQEIFSLTSAKSNEESGKYKRIFENVNFHISEDDPVMTVLLDAYKQLHQKLLTHDADRFRHKRRFLCDIIENYACPDLIDPVTGFLKADLIEVLKYQEAYSQMDESQKKKITEYFMDAYLFYFLTPIFQALNNKNSVYEPINFEDIQSLLVKFEKLKATETIKQYLTNDEFKYAHQLILESVNSKRYYYFSDRSKAYKLYDHLRKNPHVAENIKKCMGYYEILGESYAFAAQALLTETNNAEGILSGAILR